MSTTRNILVHALLSRFLITLLQLLARELAPPFDQSVELFFRQQFPHFPGKLSKLSFIFNWDGLQYLGIAFNGYQYDQNGAFLPLLPWILRLFISLSGTENPNILIYISFLYTNILFVISVLLFSHLSQLFFSKYESYCATLLYVYSPATAHLSAVYTESPTAIFSFTCVILYAQYMKSKSDSCDSLVLLSVTIFLSTCLRSNNVLLSVFYLVPCCVRYLLYHRNVTALFIISLSHTNYFLSQIHRICVHVFDSTLIRLLTTNESLILFLFF